MASCAATSVPKTRRSRRPDDVRMPCFSSSPRGRDSSSAGRMPQSTDVITVSAAANRRTRASIPISSRRGTAGGASATSIRDSDTASSRPSTLPARASSPDSASSWHMMRARPAPSALRTAISRWRVCERASIRLAILAHAISRTNPTAPSAIQRRVLDRPMTSSLSGDADPLRTDARPLSSAGYISRAFDCTRARVSACACAAVTPGFSRAMTLLL